MSESESGSEFTEEDIRRRAYEISQGPDPGTPEENWHRAVEELRGGRAPHDTGSLDNTGSLDQGADVDSGAEPS